MKLLPLSLSILFATPALASDWVVDAENSRVEIETTAFGAAVSGAFGTFEADIALDPADLSNASIIGRVEVGSGDTGNPQYNSEMTGGNGLDASNHPLAVFTSSQITQSDVCEDGEGMCYLATGELELAGNAQSADLPFRLVIDGDTAIANGEMSVARADYGIGGGEWGASAQTVRVLLHIEASRAQ